MNRDSQIIEIEMEKIVPNRFQPRKTFNDDISELAESIRTHGVLQPITVRPLGEKYEIIMGERRYRACEKLGLKKIPCMLVKMSDQESMEVALIENLQRQDLSPIEEALSYKRILDAGNITQDQLAKRLGKNQSTIANKLRLLSLDKEVQNALLRNQISERHARTLLSVEDKEEQRKLLNRIISERLTVRKTEEEVKKIENKEKIVEIIDLDDLNFENEIVNENKREVDEMQNNNQNKALIPSMEIIDDFELGINLPTLETNHSFNNNYDIENLEPEKFVLDNIQPDSIESLEEVSEEKNLTFDEMLENSVKQTDFSAVQKILDRCINDIRTLGYEINTEKFDFETMYQFIIKINK